MNLQVIISPAKKMRRAGADSAADDVSPRGIPPFPELSGRLAARLKAMDRSELQELWRTSDKLTDESLEMTRDLEIPQTPQDAREPRMAARLTPALLTYDGIQYRSMAPEVLDTPALEWLQRHLWMLSGIHGCARPLDAVMPYRLEMGAKLSMPAIEAAKQASTSGTRGLYQFWGDRIARRIAQAGQVAGTPSGQAKPAPTPSDVCVVNLASVEYSKAVTPHLGIAGPNDSPIPCVTCIFGEDLRNGKPVQRSTASKAARGSMVRWMAEREIDDPCDLQRFDIGYRHSEELSREGHLVFMRKA